LAYTTACTTVQAVIFAEVWCKDNVWSKCCIRQMARIWYAADSLLSQHTEACVGVFADVRTGLSQCLEHGSVS